jgi:hypothetical protein
MAGAAVPGERQACHRPTFADVAVSCEARSGAPFGRIMAATQLRQLQVKLEAEATTFRDIQKGAP